MWWCCRLKPNLLRFRPCVFISEPMLRNLSWIGKMAHMAVVPPALTSSAGYVLYLARNVHFTLSAIKSAMANIATEIAERFALLSVALIITLVTYIWTSIAISRFLLGICYWLLLKLLYLLLLIYYFALQSLYFALHLL